MRKAKMSEKTFDSVETMVDALSGGDSFADGVKKRIRANRVVTGLQAMRVAKGISQARIACSPVTTRLARMRFFTPSANESPPDRASTIFSTESNVFSDILAFLISFLGRFLWHFR